MSLVVSLGFVLAFFIGFFLILYFRTFSLKSPRNNKENLTKQCQISEENLNRLSGALKIQSISVGSADVDADKKKFGVFEDFFLFLNESFPVFHQTCKLVKINSFGLLYSWEPKSVSQNLLPVLLMAHQDVVPVEAGTEKNWKYPPFGGCVEEGKIWGRGSLDIKSQLIAHMCAVEKLIKKKFSPKRTFYFAYGFDEELAGQNGARKIAEYLFAKNIRLEGVLDEGGCVLTEVMKGVDPPLAGVGVGEKGHCNFVLTVGAGSGTSSHSSMPPPHTALGYAGQLICALEANPMPARLTPTMRVMLQNIGGEMGFLPRLAIANIVLFRPLLLALLARVPTLNALVRTTLAVTMAHGSDAPNALPACAEVVVNARILPGDTLDSVEAHIRTVAARARVTLTSVRRIHASSPSALSRHDTRMYRHIERLVAEIYPGAVCTPMLLVGGTDSVHYASLCDNVYRFMPFLITDTEKNTIHGTNEYISIANFARMIYFFEQFIFHYDE